MFRYAEVNQDGVVIGISQLSGELNLPNMILLSENEIFVSLGWRYIDGKWYEPLPIESVPLGITLQDIKEMQLTLMEAMADIYGLVSP